MTTRISWGRDEIALLFRAHERIAEGADVNAEAEKLSQLLKAHAIQKGILVNEIYRNVNGIKMQLAKVLYLFTAGEKGLSGASTAIHQMYELYKTNPAEYQKIVNEASQLNRTPMSVEDAFFAYAKDRTFLAPGMLKEYLQKASDYCHLPKSLLGMLDVEAARRVQKTIASGKLPRFRFGKDVQNIRKATQLYYNFVRSHQQSVQDNAPPKEIPPEMGTANTAEDIAADPWLAILQDSFPDGYILDDFLSQFQASAYWQERYGDVCPLEGAEIDEAIKASGSVRDGRVFVKNDRDSQLIAEICAEVDGLLSRYSTVYRSCIYERYQQRLAACSIYTETVMTQQLLDMANGSFYATYQIFSKTGQKGSVTEDCEKVLRDHGGAMKASDVAKELWFIPSGQVYHSLSACDDVLNIGNGAWMLAEHFPLTAEDATKVGDMLEEYFLRQDLVKTADLMDLLREHLPSIAGNLSDLPPAAVFNILCHYLDGRFSFSKTLITPKGPRTDFCVLFQNFARERDRFTLDELSAFASELPASIYWESTFRGAVRVSETEFVNRKQVKFDVVATDKVLEIFCPEDYLPLQDVSSAMMMHLPPCGYQWNGYLLLSYVYGFSRMFRLSYNSLGKVGCYGAMVRRSCESIDCYDRLVERILTDDDTWTTEEEALDMLVRKGIQARRRLSGIDRRVAQARQNKLSGRR